MPLGLKRGITYDTADNVLNTYLFSKMTKKLTEGLKSMKDQFEFDSCSKAATGIDGGEMNSSLAQVENIEADGVNKAVKMKGSQVDDAFVDALDEEIEAGKKKEPEVNTGTLSSVSNKQKLLDALKAAPVEYRKNPKTGVMEPYRKQIQITDEYKVILRRDVGDFNHGDLDHWNLEIQTTTGGNIKYDLHLYLGDDGNILPFTEDNIYIPKKSPFH